MIRNGVGGHGCRVPAVLKLNAGIASDMRGDESEDFEEELVECGPTRDSGWT